MKIVESVAARREGEEESDLFRISRHDGEDGFGDEFGEEIFRAVLLRGEGRSEGEDEGFFVEGSFESFDGEFWRVGD